MGAFMEQMLQSFSIHFITTDAAASYLKAPLQ